VVEKGGQKEVKLGYAEVRSGSVIYRSVPAEVTFRLELTLRDDRTFVESLFWRTPATTVETPRTAPSPFRP
jgi:hypothetical protein